MEELEVENGSEHSRLSRVGYWIRDHVFRKAERPEWWLIDDDNERIDAWMKANGFRRSFTIKMGYSPPYPNPGGDPMMLLADPETKKRVLENRKRTHSYIYPVTNPETDATR